ncbi:hypothetical protein D3C78_1557230 [compost metagenome]
MAGAAALAGHAPTAAGERQGTDPVAYLQVANVCAHGHHFPCIFVAGDRPGRKVEARSMPLGHVQIAAAYAAAVNLHHHVAGTRGRIRERFDHQGLARRVKHR